MITRSLLPTFTTIFLFFSACAAEKENDTAVNSNPPEPTCMVYNETDDVNGTNASSLRFHVQALGSEGLSGGVRCGDTNEYTYFSQVIYFFTVEWDLSDNGMLDLAEHSNHDDVDSDGDGDVDLGSRAAIVLDNPIEFPAGETASLAVGDWGPATYGFNGEDNYSTDDFGYQYIDAVTNADAWTETAGSPYRAAADRPDHSILIRSHVFIVETTEETVEDFGPAFVDGGNNYFCHGSVDYNIPPGEPEWCDE